MTAIFEILQILDYIVDLVISTSHTNIRLGLQSVNCLAVWIGCSVVHLGLFHRLIERLLLLEQFGEVDDG